MSARPQDFLPSQIEIDRERFSRPGGLRRFIQTAWEDAHVQPVDFVPGWHIEVECEYLEAFIDGEIPRLLINIPPGHMKSLGCSVFLHPWTWGPKGLPQKRFVNTSYRDDLALRDAVASRDLIRSRWYQERWGALALDLDEDDRVVMRPDQDTKQRYTNLHGGYRFSCPVAGIMGEGGDYVINDDPHNVEVAESDHVRDEVVRRLSLALPSRVRSDDGGYLVIMQRLHSRDYSGHMLADKEGLVHLCLPARFEYDHPNITLPTRTPRGTRRKLPGDRRLNKKIYKEYCALRDKAKETEDNDDAKKAKIYATQHNGELLWKEFYNEERVSRLEADTALGQYGSAGQLQQRPTPREGGLFQREWFNRYCEPDDVPKMVAEVRGWDLAGTERKTSPYTAGVRLGMDRAGVIYVRHACRKQVDAGVMRAYVKGYTEEDGHGVNISVPQDPGQAGKQQVRDFQRELRGWPLHWSPESGSKIQRAETFAPECKANNVVLVRGAWNVPWLDEMTEFPGGNFADYVDATSRAYGRLVQLTSMIERAVAGGQLIEG